MYHERVRYAIFYDPRQGFAEMSMVPSVIAVQSLEDSMHPRYCFGYEAMPQAMKLIKDLDLPTRARSFEETCSIQVRVRLSQQQDFLERTAVLPIFVNQLSD